MRHFHCWIEFRNIDNGDVVYYRVCKHCGQVQKWQNGYYFDVEDKVSKQWQLADNEEDFFNNINGNERGY